MALIGHQDSNAYIGPIAPGSMIFNFIYWGLAFLKMGTPEFTAQERGRRDLQKTIAVFSRTALVAISMRNAMLISTIGFFFRVITS